VPMSLSLRDALPNSYLRDGKEHAIYSKVVEADGPRAIVIPRTGQKTRLLRDRDIAWTDFLSDRVAYDAVSCRPGDHMNIVFSSRSEDHTSELQSRVD